MGDHGAYISFRSLLEFLFNGREPQDARLESSSTLNSHEEEEEEEERPLQTCNLCLKSLWPRSCLGGFVNEVVFSADANRIFKEGSTLVACRVFPEKSSGTCLQSPSDCYTLLRCWGTDKKENLPRLRPLFTELEAVRRDGIVVGNRRFMINSSHPSSFLHFFLFLFTKKRKINH